MMMIDWNFDKLFRPVIRLIHAQHILMLYDFVIATVSEQDRKVSGEQGQLAPKIFFKEIEAELVFRPVADQILSNSHKNRIDLSFLSAVYKYVLKPLEGTV